MKRLTYDRAALTLPLVVPVLAGFAFSWLPDDAWPPWLWYLVLSPVMGGIPYLVFGTTIALILPQLTPRSVSRLPWIAPLIFTSIIGTPIGLLAMLVTSPGDRLGMLFLFVGAPLALGYGYVLPVELLRRVGERRGWLERAEG